jgi:hypothetical protein
MKFLKKLWNTTADLTWTLVGSVIVLITLSGETQKIAFYLTVGGLFVHYVYKLTQSEN